MIWLLIALYGVGGLLWLLCALAYGVLAPWWRSWIGRSLVGASAFFSAALILTVVLAFVPMPHALAFALAAGVLSAVDLAGLVQLLTILHTQLRRDDTPHRRATDRQRQEEVS